jgi:NAD-dependent dihydropyrimidine dehydrogenase PreA subunit
MIVITDDCIECGSCIDECPNEAISESDGKYVIDPELCSECQSCMDICPNEAIVEQ